MAPATGFTSTAEDLCAYFTAHCFGDDRLLQDASKRRMQRPAWTPRRNEHYGLGLQLLDLDGGRRLIGHAGGYPGHATKTWCDPRAGFVVTVLTNAIDGPAHELCTGLVRLIDNVAARRTAPPAHAGGVDLRRFTGRYFNLWSGCDVTVLDGNLLLVWLDTCDPAETVGTLVAEGPTEVRFAKAADGYSNEGELFTYTFDAAGAVTSLRGSSAMLFWPWDAYEREYLGRPRVTLTAE